MGDLNFQEFQPYIFLMLGLGIILYTLFKKTRNANLKASGEKVEGIVFELGRTIRSVGGGTVMNKVTIRFVTKEKEWITADIKQDFANFYSNQYKEGEPVVIFYDKQNPQNFYVDTKQNETKARIFVFLIGFVFLGVGIYQVLRAKSII
jgi:hypothetical protein